MINIPINYMYRPSLYKIPVYATGIRILYYCFVCVQKINFSSIIISHNITFLHVPLVESNLVIREGRTSNGRLLQWFNGSRCMDLDVAIEVGYYVRLTGTFNSSSRLEIAYSAFAQSSNYT